MRSCTGSAIAGAHGSAAGEPSPACPGAALLGVPLSFALAFLLADRVESVLADVRRVERWFALGAVLALGLWLAARAHRSGRRA